MTRTKRTIINFITDAFPQIIIAVLGIFKTKVFLEYLGENTLGLYQLYSQLFSYLGFLEIGISSAVLYCLYKPTTDKDYNELKRIYNGSNHIFKIIGSLILVLGLILSFFISFFIKNNVFKFSFLQLTFILYVISNIFNYFFMSKKLMFYAHEKNYIPNLIYQLFTVLKSILEIVLVYIGFDLLVILVLGVIINLAINLLLDIVYRKSFKFLPNTKDKSFIFSKDLKSVCVHKFSNLISNNIDIVLISSFIGLNKVVIYTSYQYIILSIQLLTDKFSNSILSSVGNLLKENRERANQVFTDFNNILYFVALAICIPLYFALDPFIYIWYNGSIETSNILALLFSVLLFINIIRQNSNLFINTLGLFKETQFCSVIDIFLNLVLSFILIKVAGVKGVVFSTIISLVITELFLKNRIILKLAIEKKYFYYLQFIFPFLFMLIINVLVVNTIFNIFVLDSILMWLLCCIIVFTVNLVLLIIEFIFFKKFNCITKILKELVKK